MPVEPANPLLQFAAGLVGAVLGAFLIRIATRLVAGFTPAFGRAFSAALLGFLGTFLLGSVLGSMTTPAAGAPLDPTSLLLVAAMSFLIQSGAYWLVLRTPPGDRLTFGRACGVSAVQTLMAVAIIAVVLVLLAVIGKFAG